MFAALGRGAAAGAAGTSALNAITYLDMAWRGRGSSDTPQRTVETLAEKAGHPVPGEGSERSNRLTGLGSLAGIATGVGIGVAAGVLGPVIAKLPAALGATALGAAAMAATDLSMVRLGISDPRQWSAADWLSDAVPHLGYGAVTVWTLRALRAGKG